MNPRPLVILSGGRGGGKTSACRATAILAAARGARAGGLLSPSLRGPDGRPLSIEAEDLASGERRLLAGRGAELGGPSWPPDGSLPAGEAAFGFSGAAIAWAIGQARGAIEAGVELFVLDEIGPLELSLRAGFFPLLARVAARSPRTAALISVRPSLAARLSAIMEPHIAAAGGRAPRIVELDPDEREKMPRILADSLGLL